VSSWGQGSHADQFRTFLDRIAGGTRTTLHTFGSPARYRISCRTNAPTSNRSDFARRFRRFTSMLAESTT
jgi:hypothetical protein